MKTLSYSVEGTKPAAFIFQESHLANFELLYLHFQKIRQDLQLAQKKPALPTSIHSPWMFHVQPTQAQHMLPGDSLLPFLVLMLLWYRIFPSNSNLLPLLLKLELTSFPSRRWLQIVVQIQPVRGGKPSAQMALPGCLAAVFWGFFSQNPQMTRWGLTKT